MTTSTPAERHSALSAEPERTCVGCRERGTKFELLRVTRGADSDGRAVVAPDPRGTASGRGAYLHPTMACLAQAERRRAFGRALRHTEGSLSLSEVKRYLETATQLTKHHPEAEM